jgi:hypothetical protein
MRVDQTELAGAFKRDLRYIYEEGLPDDLSQGDIPDLAELAAIVAGRTGGASLADIIEAMLFRALNLVQVDHQEGLEALFGLGDPRTIELTKRRDIAAPLLDYRNADSLRRSKKGDPPQLVTDLLLDDVVEQLIILAKKHPAYWWTFFGKECLSLSAAPVDEGQLSISRSLVATRPRLDESNGIVNPGRLGKRWFLYIDIRGLAVLGREPDWSMVSKLHIRLDCTAVSSCHHRVNCHISDGARELTNRSLNLICSKPFTIDYFPGSASLRMELGIDSFALDDELTRIYVPLGTLMRRAVLTAAAEEPLPWERFLPIRREDAVREPNFTIILCLRLAQLVTIPTEMPPRLGM